MRRILFLNILGNKICQLTKNNKFLQTPAIMSYKLSGHLEYLKQLILIISKIDQCNYMKIYKHYVKLLYVISSN